LEVPLEDFFLPELKSAHFDYCCFLASCKKLVLPKLEYLKIGHCAEEGIQIITEQTTMPSLTTLDFDNCKCIDARFLHSICANIQQKSPLLKSLSFGYNSIGVLLPSTMELLSTMNLNRLFLQSNPICMKNKKLFVDNLVPLVQKCPSITHVLFSNPAYECLESHKLAVTLCMNAARKRILGSQPKPPKSLWSLIFVKATTAFDNGWMKYRKQGSIPQLDAVFILLKERAATDLFGV